MGHHTTTRTGSRIRTSDPARSMRAAGLLVASAAFAVSAATRAHADTGHVVLAAATLDQVIGNIRTWLIGLLAALATTFLTIGGVKYLIAGGDPGEVEKAKNALRSAAIGYGLAILAPALVGILQHIVGGS
ncbi:pilin [Catenulispora pinisilvae]|uniref:pilin n=1 Tax=Catenulispora pinisilvae TaxID=2705253 RepID=UPI001E3A2A94|nr:pilin [Catenulispora pinisilvae]